VLGDEWNESGDTISLKGVKLNGYFEVYFLLNFRLCGGFSVTQIDRWGDFRDFKIGGWEVEWA